MIIVNINSQLGNQMFQYALYRKLQLLGKIVKADLRYFEQKPEHYSLNIFPIKIENASDKQILCVRDENRSFINRLRRKVFSRKKNVYYEITNDLKELKFRPEIFNKKNIYLDGYWQSEKYFTGIREVLLCDFVFPRIEDPKNINILKKIRQVCSVSIHIRRGDYLDGFHIVPLSYYQKAIKYFEDKYEDVCFFVFSDDMIWSKENISFKQGDYIDWNIGKMSYRDMYLMTQCKHNILANSSFSWWGAWLNIHSEQEVIAPKKWSNELEMPDIYCKNWIKM